MRNKLSGILVTIVLALILLTACQSNIQEVNQISHEPSVVSGDNFGRFKIIESKYYEDANTYQYIMYDKETYVMYVYLGSRTNGGICPLYNTDGSIMVYYEAMNAVG